MLRGIGDCEEKESQPARNTAAGGILYNGMRGMDEKRG